MTMVERQDAQDYYSARWSAEEKANLWAMQRASVILSELALCGVDRPQILDLGCGTGWMTQVLHEFGDAQGVDLAPDAARRRYPHLHFYDSGSAPEGPFDIVVSQEVLEHVEDQASYVDEAARVLGKGGYLILTTPNAVVSLRHPELLVQPIEKHVTRGQLRRLLEPRFNVVRLYSFFYGYARWRPYRLQLRFGRLLNAGLHLIAVGRRR